MASERELKFSSTGERRPTPVEIEAALGGAGYTVTSEGEHQQRDRYFDDALGSLELAGIALRRRSVDGRRLATFKTAGSVRGALHEREEIELPLAATGWPAEILARLDGIVDAGTLRNRVMLLTIRDRYLVSHSGGGDAGVATLSFDEVSASLPGRAQTVSFSEVEIEALGATANEELERIAELLDRVVKLNPSGTTKLERAVALLDLATWGD